MKDNYLVNYLKINYSINKKAVKQKNNQYYMYLDMLKLYY